MKIIRFGRNLKIMMLTSAFALLSSILLAQENSNPEAMDHSTMDHSAMVNTDQAPGHQPQSMNMGKLEGDSLATLRDPHAYSGGFTLSDGPYAQDGPRQLKLADEHIFKALLANRFEYDVDNDTALYDLQGWVGTTYDRLVLKAEGDVIDGTLEESQTDILWGHAISAFWDAQLGVRFDSFEEGESRQWLAIGVQGLAPYWFELDVAGYVDDEGRTALALEAEYELLFTQRIVLQPRAEVTAYGKNDEVNGVGKGLSNVSLGFRLRYEVTRQFAPYLGVEWTRVFSKTADLAQAEDQSTNETRYVAGLKFWF